MRLIFNAPVDVTSEKIRLLKSRYGKQTIVVLVHASWCHHCTAFRPDWTRFCASKPELLLVEVEADTIGRLAAYDAEAFSLLARDVNGFPTVFMYRTGVRPARESFKEERSVKGLEEFVKETQSAPVIATRPSSAPAKLRQPPAPAKAPAKRPATAPAKKPATAPAKRPTSAKPKPAPAKKPPPFSSPKSPKSAPKTKSI